MPTKEYKEQVALYIDFRLLKYMEGCKKTNNLRILKDILYVHVYIVGE